MLIERMARENPRWGYQRIQGEFLTLDHRVRASATRRVLTRSRHLQHRSGTTDTTGRQFLRAQTSMMVACDFFPADYAVTLQQISMFVVLEIGTRPVHLLDATTNPDCRWTTHHIRTLVRALSG